MSEYAGQDNGTLRVTIREAASRLGVTEAAIRKRIQRGSLDKELGEDGRVYVYLDLYQNMSHPKSQVDHEALVEELRDRVRFLERELDRRSVEAERYQHIVAGLATTNTNLTDRLKELEAPDAQAVRPQDPKHAPQNVVEEQEKSGQSPKEPLDPVPQAPMAEGASGVRGMPRSWWRRVFG